MLGIEGLNQTCLSACYRFRFEKKKNVFMTYNNNNNRCFLLFHTVIKYLFIY